jgi:AcrR family transcriptional regulator
MVRTPKKRSYTLKQRAESQEATRQRIVEAAVELHEELGPRATTVSAIAERAGVQRLTVYRHFPTEADVIAACSSHWTAMNPAPDASLWREAGGGPARARIGVTAFCAYYTATQAMWKRIYEDVGDVPAVRAPLAEYAKVLDAAAADLAAGYGGRRKAVLATLRHAIAFSTWAELEERGIGDKDKAALMMAWLDGAARGSGY